MDISNFLNWAQDMQRNPSTEYIDEAGMAKLGRMAKVKQNDPSWQDKIKKEARKQELKQKFRASQKVMATKSGAASGSNLIKNAKQAQAKNATAQMRLNKMGKAEARRKHREERLTNPAAREAHKRGEKPKFSYDPPDGGAEALKNKEGKAEARRKNWDEWATNPAAREKHRRGEKPRFQYEPAGGVVDTDDPASASKSSEASGETDTATTHEPEKLGSFKKAWAKARTSSAVGNMQAGGTNPYKDGIGVGDVANYIGAGGANAGGGASIQKRAALRKERRQRRDEASINAIRKSKETENDG